VKPKFTFLKSGSVVGFIVIQEGVAQTPIYLQKRFCDFMNPETMIRYKFSVPLALKDPLIKYARSVGVLINRLTSFVNIDENFAKLILKSQVPGCASLYQDLKDLKEVSETDNESMEFDSFDENSERSVNLLEPSVEY
jgi:hypothetical protein